MIDTAHNLQLAEHAAGDSFRALAKRHGGSHEHMRQVVMEQATALVNDVELSLYLAQKYERMGRQSDAVWPSLVARWGGDGWRLTLALLQYVLDRLRSRDVEVSVVTQAVPDQGATIFMIVLKECAE